MSTEATSHIGSKIIHVPKSVDMSIVDFPPHPNPLRPLPKKMADFRTISITGPLGQQMLPMFPQCTLEKVPDEASGSASGAAAGATSGQAEEGYDTWKVALTVSNTPEGPNQGKGRWGLMRQLVNNAVVGVTEGHSKVLRLVGVGYRAALEETDIPPSDSLSKALRAPAPGEAAPPTYWTSPEQEKAYRDLYEKRAARAQSLGLKKQMLVLRLGYSHPIMLPVPEGVTAETPQPTRIVLKGVDPGVLGEFAATVRRWRPPEPYKGKGVFINDEDIKLKVAKKK
ncbi:unnamed protein product [Parajaminaea phylloscopi]